MSLEERSFSGNLFRPRPEFFEDPTTGALIIATPWGPREAAKTVITVVSDYIQAAQSDAEATTPFPRLPDLSNAGNMIRIATLLAHETVHSRFNKEEYTAGVELLVALHDGEEFVWMQLGLPHVLLLREGHPITPLSGDIDLSAFPAFGGWMAPLPERILGLEKSLPVRVSSLRRKEGDRFLLLARSHMPPQIFMASSHSISLPDVSEMASQENGEIPFWCSLWTPNIA